MIPESLKFPGWESVAYRHLDLSHTPTYWSLEYRMKTLHEWNFHNFREAFQAMLIKLYEAHPNRGGKL